MPNYEEMIRQAAQKYGVNPTILINMLKQESGNFREDIVTGKTSSPAGAQGIAQFMPATAREMGVDPLNPVSAIDGAARYLKQNLDQFGSYSRAVAAYNWGPGNVARDPSLRSMPEETRNYLNIAFKGVGENPDKTIQADIGGGTVPGPTGSAGSGGTTQYGGIVQRMPFKGIGIDGYVIPGIGIVKPTKDGNFTASDGSTVDKWGNRFNPTTGKWYNQQGQEWTGTDPGTGRGTFGSPRDTIDASGRVTGGSSGSDALDFGSLGGVPSWYYRGQLDQAQQKFNADETQRQRQNSFDMTQFNYKRATDEIQHALSIGDFELAKQKQAEANMWQQKGMELQQSTADNSNKTSIYNNQLDNETIRMNNGQQNQIGGYNAETSRFGQYATAAQNNNQFILDASTKPRDLFGLYFMQRGMTPDWGNLMAGGKPTMGSPLSVQNPMTAFTPTLQMPQTFMPGDFKSSITNPYASGMGASSLDFSPRGGTMMPGQPGYTFQGSGVPSPSYGSSNPFSGSDPFRYNPFSNPQAKTGGYNPSDYYQPTARKPIEGVDYIHGGPTDMGFSGGVTGTATSSSAPAGGYNPWQGKAANPGAYQAMLDFRGSQGVPGFASGGYTRDSQFMVGDAPSSNPMAGGARPEMVYNPTHAPIQIVPNHMSMMDFGMNRYALGTGAQGYADQGMGSMYMQSSANPGVNPAGLPPAMKMLYDYGAPLPPSLVSATTGGTLGQAAGASAFRQRGGGALTSMQQLGNMSPGEQEMYRGYGEGVVGIPWNDLLDYISKPTQNLGSAQRSQGI